MGAMAAETGTQAIDRAAELLVGVVESPRPVTVGALSQRSGLPKSTTSRLVGALRRRGVVQGSSDHRLRPGRPVRGARRRGPRGGRAVPRCATRDASQSLVELARPSLTRLADASG